MYRGKHDLQMYNFRSGEKKVYNNSDLWQVSRTSLTLFIQGVGKVLGVKL